MIYFTSDLHFGHENVIRFNNRPFRNEREMSRVLITNYNSIVKPDDTVYLLGDLAYKIGADQANVYFQQLNGRKILIIGNHDRYEEYDASLFEEITHYMYLRTEGVSMALMHYPILDWQGGRNKGGLMLHGHMHNTPEYNVENRVNGIRRYDVGVDANYYFPVSLTYIKGFFGIE